MGFHPLAPSPLFFGLQRKVEEKKQAARLRSPGHLWHCSPWLWNVACLLWLTEKTNGQPWRLRSNHPRHNKPSLLSARLCQGGSGVLGGRDKR